MKNFQRAKRRLLRRRFCVAVFRIMEKTALYPGQFYDLYGMLSLSTGFLQKHPTAQAAAQTIALEVGKAYGELVGRYLDYYHDFPITQASPAEAYQKIEEMSPTESQPLRSLYNLWSELQQVKRDPLKVAKVVDDISSIAHNLGLGFIEVEPELEWFSRALFETASPDSLSRILRHMSPFVRDLVRMDLAGRGKQIEPPKWGETYAYQYVNHPSIQKRRRAVRYALYNRDVHSLIRFLREDKDSMARLLAIRALGELGQEEILREELGRAERRGELATKRVIERLLRKHKSVE